MYLLESGLADVRFPANKGIYSTIHLVRPGEVLGGLGPNGMPPPPWNAYALAECSGLEANAEEFAAKLAAQPWALRAANQMLLLRQDELAERLRSTHLDRVEQRLVNALLALAAFWRKGEEDTADIRLPQRDLASMANSSRETVATRLGALEKEGLLELGFRSVKIPSIVKLKIYSFTC